MENEYYKQISQAGEELIKAIGGLVQIVKMHMDNNALVVEAVDHFIYLLVEAGRKEADVSLQHMDGRFYFLKKKIFIRPENKRTINRTLQYLRERNISSFHFENIPDALSRAGITCFARLLDDAGKHDEPSEWLKAQLEGNRINWVEVNRRVFDGTGDLIQPTDSALAQDQVPDLKKAQARKHYAHVLGAVKDVSLKLSSGQNVGMRNVVRLVQKMVDIVTEDETLFSILGTVRIYDDYTYSHSLNVAILSMCLGKRVGLNHMMLERLGLCGLFHDLGKVEIPKSILNKRGPLQQDELDVIRSHPVHSARLILKLKASRERKIKLLMAPFEHHMGYNQTGYPQTGRKHSVSLFGRILTIADVYDAITSPRIYRGSTLSPDKALGYMLEQSGTSFDPLLLKLFINMLGAYPVGTLVKLDSGEIGIVTGPSQSNDRRHPVVRILMGDATTTYRKGPVVDLSAHDRQSEEPCRNIVESMHPADLGIQAAEFIL